VLINPIIRIRTHHFRRAYGHSSDILLTQLLGAQFCILAILSPQQNFKAISVSSCKSKSYSKQRDAQIYYEYSTTVSGLAIGLLFRNLIVYSSCLYLVACSVCTLLMQTYCSYYQIAYKVRKSAVRQYFLIKFPT
jgi:tetrahydromethanopterin S-methyltransferase subunit F